MSEALHGPHRRDIRAADGEGGKANQGNHRSQHYDSTAVGARRTASWTIPRAAAEAIRLPTDFIEVLQHRSDREYFLGEGEARNL